ncbi:MAG: hypothetical protein OET55_03465 [Desulfuromonadales bacterium]|jgi:hypothetical protein|nr:hypothetical protein [Desulfuromonadales bacterium]MDH3960315.1 hypothetical protein [Desulfuromonadales bacterium]
MPERRGLRKAGQNPIEVIMSDGTYHHLTPQVLDVLLENNRVIKFRRESGWVAVGVDPIRLKSRSEASHIFNGHERRAIN